MKDTDIISNLQAGLSVAGGRHLYGVLGSYAALAAFATRLTQASAPDGQPSRRRSR
jgi:hypothetical protein